MQAVGFSAPSGADASAWSEGAARADMMIESQKFAANLCPQAGRVKVNGAA